MIWVASDRGVEAFAGETTGTPEAVTQLAREAKTAGVRLIVSREALQRLGVDPIKLDPEPDEIAGAVWERFRS